MAVEDPAIRIFWDVHDGCKTGNLSVPYDVQSILRVTIESSDELKGHDWFLPIDRTTNLALLLCVTLSLCTSINFNLGYNRISSTCGVQDL
jgi:hypothetical protein